MTDEDVLDRFIDKLLDKLAKEIADTILFENGKIPVRNSEFVIDVLTVFDKLLSCRHGGKWDTRCLDIVYDMVITIIEKYSDYWK